MPAQKLIDNYSLRNLKMDAAILPSNPSQQGLVNNEQDPDFIPAAVKISDDDPGISIGMNRRRGVSCKAWITVIILFVVNLINYMDRYTVAGVLSDLSEYFHVANNLGLVGFIQTAFVISYMIFAPLFGYLGDRYSRKIIIALGLLLWSITTLGGSFMKTYWWFIAFRAMVGIGEASYSTIAPTIISDLFVSDLRSKMLAFFYFAIPVGSGMGYIVGSQMSHWTGQWQWGLRVTPVIGIVAVIFILFVMVDPPRGESEGSHLSSTTWSADISYLVRNRSFMLSTLAFTAVTFVTGALAFWGPLFIYYGSRMQNPEEPESAKDHISFIFGVIAMLSGLIGVPLGSFVAQRLRQRYPRADPLVCAFGALASAPLMFIGAVLANKDTAWCFVAIFFGELFLNMNWSIVADMCLYVVIPTRRSTAEAFQILFSHTLGDAGSPTLIGLISAWIADILRSEISASGIHSSSLLHEINYSADTFNVTITDKNFVEFTSLQYSLFITVFVEVIAGLFFLATAWYIVEDKAKADDIIAGREELLDCQTQQPIHIYADDASIDSLNSVRS